MNSDSSISERIAQRDARVARARELLRRARTEQERGDAVCEELDAEIEFEEGVARWARWPAPALAAMVKIGRLSAEEALEVATSAPRARDAEVAFSLVELLTAQRWVALEGRFRSLRQARQNRLRRAIEERDRAGVVLLLEAEPIDDRSILDAALAFGCDVLRAIGDRARARVRELAGVAARQAVTGRAIWALALDEDDRAAEHAAIRALLEADGLWATKAWFSETTQVTIAIAIATDLAPLCDLLERACSWSGLTVDYELVYIEQLLSAARQLATPEQFAEIEDRTLRAIEAGCPDLLPALTKRATGPWRARFEREVQSKFDAESTAWKWDSDGLRPDQRNQYWRSLLSALIREPTPGRLARRMKLDRAFAEEIASWTPRHIASGPIDPQLVPILLDAARAGHAAAIDALSNWDSPAEVLHRIPDALARHCTHKSMRNASSVTSQESEDQGCAPGTPSFFSELDDALIARLLDSIAFAPSTLGVQLPDVATRLIEASSPELQRAFCETTDWLRAQSTRWIDRRFRTDSAKQWIEDELDGPARTAERTLRTLEDAGERTVASLPRGAAALARASMTATRRRRDASWSDAETPASASIASRCVRWMPAHALCLYRGGAVHAWGSPDPVEMLARIEQLLRESRSNSGLEALRAEVLDVVRRIAENNSWARFVAGVCEDRDRASRARAATALFAARPWLDLDEAQTCVALGVADEVLASIDETIVEQCAEAVSALLEAASEGARDRGLRVFREGVCRIDRLARREVVTRWLRAEDIVENWGWLVQDDRTSLLEPSLLRCVGGQALIDRIAERTAQWLSRERGRRGAQ